MVKITINRKSIDNYGVLEVATGTNCPQGGDGGKGGRTVLCLSGMIFDVKLGTDKYRCVDDIEIVVGGDAECENFIEALEFATETLKNQIEENISAEIHEVP